METIPFNRTLEEATPIFLIAFEIRTGGKEYVLHKTARAPNIDKAIEVAYEYMSDFWGSDTTKDDDYELFWNNDFSESINISSVNVVTPEQLVQRLSIRS